MPRTQKRSSTKSSKATRTPKRTPSASRFFLLHQTVLIAVVIGIIAIVGLSAAFHITYASRFPHRTHIGDLSVGGMTKEQAVYAVQSYLNDLEASGYPFWRTDASFGVPPTLTATDDPDLSYDVYSIDAALSVDHAWSSVHDGSTLMDILKIAKTFAYGSWTPAVAFVNQEELSAVLKEQFGADDQSAQNSRFQIVGNTITATEHSAGQVINYLSAGSLLRYSLENMEKTPITLERIDDVPSVERPDATALIPTVRSVLDRAPFIVSWEDHDWTFDRVAAETWFIPIRDNDGAVRLGINPDALQTSFATDITPFISLEVQEGKFLLEDNRVTEFQPSQEGRAIDGEQTAKRMGDDIVAVGGNRSTIAVTIVEPQFAVDDLNDLGIKEIIGVGRSNMRGSPANRRYNIDIGADTLNGILIPPDETFSLVKALGAIDGEHGYRQELVIKGNATVPEYGGGLCQIGTTTFRAALNSGLPIVERQNHSYQVSYYFDENGKSGTDATIYDPAPDFKFTNDTGHYIMIQTHIDGNDVVFEFWGTRDGRAASQTSPVISNVTPPPPTKLVETTDLAPGEKKCTEHAHNGATAVFTYAVQYADGREESEDFKSVYKPWQEVCLIGVDPAELEDTADETPGVETAGDTNTDKQKPSDNTNTAPTTNTNTSPKPANTNTAPTE